MVAAGSDVAAIGTSAKNGALATPRVLAESDVLSGRAPLTVHFTCNCQDPDGDDETLVYLWQLGDESTATEREVAHTFGEPGTYRVRVTAEDVAGLMGYDSVTVVVEAGDEKLPPWARIVVNNNDHDAPAQVLHTLGLGQRIDAG